MKVLVLGVTGMLGNAVFRVFSGDSAFEAWGTMRSGRALDYFSEQAHHRLFYDVDVLDQDALVKVLGIVKPAAVINCVGLIKQLKDANDPLTALPINSILPHRLSNLCALAGARLIHVSTDCVFSGRKGLYQEHDVSDAEDLYGKSKYIGELHSDPNSITLRTSIIGHELGSSHALVDWFLSQKGSVKGFAKAIFSGLPTVELARVMKDFVIPNPGLSGLYHVSSDPISKLDLLSLIAREYPKDIEIQPDSALVIDRSLDSTRFKDATGYVAPEWSELIQCMKENR